MLRGGKADGFARRIHTPHPTALQGQPFSCPASLHANPSNLLCVGPISLHQIRYAYLVERVADCAVSLRLMLAQ